MEKSDSGDIYLQLKAWDKYAEWRTSGENEKGSGFICEWDYTRGDLKLEPTITTSHIPDTHVKSDYSKQLYAAGVEPITWKAVGLPEGLSCNVSGEISGQAQVEGTYFVIVAAHNSEGDYSKSFLLEVNKRLGAELNSATFPNATFREYLHSNFDKDNDGWLDEAEIAEVKHIDVRGTEQAKGNITTLKGIEYLTALESLHCEYNNITELDLSRNVKLSWLECQQNAIKKLDISGCPSLWVVICSHNSLSQINVSGSPNIDFFDCCDNMITQLDVSKNIGLSTFLCAGNKLEELNLRSNTNLKLLSCDRNSITLLDLSNNTKLTNLYCYDNKLIWLNIDNCAELLKLNCYNNKIPVLNIGGCSKRSQSDWEFHHDSDTEIVYSHVDVPVTVEVTGDIPTTTTRRATFTATPKATGGASPYTWSITAGKLPDGLNISASTGKITGNTTNAGTFSFTVKAQDKNGIDGKKDYTVKVTQTAVSGTLPTTTTRRATYTGSPKVSGGASPYVWSISAGKLPDGLNINASTGKITGNPTKAGTFKFTVKAKDKNGAAGKKEFTVKVTQSTVSGTLPTTTTRRATYTGSPKVTGGASPYTWSISAGKLPEGLTINSSTGKITGNPTKAGTFKFTVKAKDSNGAAGKKEFTVKVTQSTVSGTLPTTTTRRATYTGSPKVSGGATPYVWSISAGKLPEGLTINSSTGKITGNPTKAGTFKFTVKAKDKNGAAGKKEFTVKVTQTKVTGDLPTSTTRRASYTGSPKVTGGASPYVWSISAGKLPDGLNINASTGKITGNPSKAGTFKFTVKAKDKNGAASSKAYTVKVTQTKVTGTLSNPIKGSSYTATPKATGGASPYTWSISAGKLPDNLKINSSTGQITGTVSKAGTFTFTVKAKDANGAAGKKEFTLKVTEATAKNSAAEDKPDSTLTAQTHNGTYSLPVMTPQALTESSGVTSSIPAPYLYVASSDILESFDGADSDIVRVNAGLPLRFFTGGWNVDASNLAVHVNDEHIDGVIVSEKGQFTLPAGIASGDFRVRVKSSNGETESQELYIISE